MLDHHRGMGQGFGSVLDQVGFDWIMVEPGSLARVFGLRDKTDTDKPVRQLVDVIVSVAALNILAFLILSKFDRVPELISENISLLVWIIGTGSAALLLLLISLIRCLSLPKLPKPVANADSKSTPHPTPPHDSH